jgi:glycosyltransferase involved in cell wall biosynthesis
MKIVWFSWKDIKHPNAGGAERVTHEIAKRLASDGHEVIIITSKPENLDRNETIDGYKVERGGNKFSVYFKAYQNYKKNHSTNTDLVIEEINTIPFFTQLYCNDVPRYLFVHQLARQIWFYQMVFPFSLVGYLLEPIYLWLLRNNKVITVSNSTMTDLVRYGYKPDNISIITEGIHIKPAKNLSTIKKYPTKTVLSVGAIRSMKNTLDQVKAFEYAKSAIPELQMKIIGNASGKYGENVLRYIKSSPYKQDIKYLGKVSDEQKTEVMQKSHVFLCTSIKEGWGLVVSENASQGTPTVAYNVDGLRDSIINGKTGILTKKTPSELANGIKELMNNDHKYCIIKDKAYAWSKTMTFDQAYKDFKKVLRI